MALYTPCCRSHYYYLHKLMLLSPAWGRGTPFHPCPFTSSSFALFLLFPFLGGFNCFLLLSIPFLSTRIVPLCFQARGRRKRPNLGLICSFYFVFFLYFLVKVDFGILLYLVWFSLVSSFSALTLLVGSFDP